MIISHKHKFIFVHVPKTGGTSITFSLINHLGPKDVVMGCLPPFEKLSWESKKNGGLHKHSKAFEINNSMGKSFDDYYSFAFIRNPYDLIVSQYYWWRTTDAKWNKTAIKLKEFVMNATFEEFVLSGRGYQKRRQFPFLFDEKTVNELTLISNKVMKDKISISEANELIRRYRKKHFLINQIEKFETFENGIKRIQTDLNLQLKVVFNNTSKELRSFKNYRSHYSQSTQSVIEKFALVDLILFDYGF
jgi:Sulfotransferase family